MAINIFKGTGLDALDLHIDYDTETDEFYIKLRVWDQDRLTKRGLIITVTDESLRSVPEGTRYPVALITSDMVSSPVTEEKVQYDTE